MMHFKSFLSKIFKERTDNTLIQLFRYGFVGGAAFVVDFGTYFLLTEFVHVHYLLSAAIAFVLGLTVNYLISISWVFNDHKMSSRAAEFAVFAVIGLVGLGLNELIIYVCTDLLGIHYLVSKIISTIMVFAWNFFARKFILFKSSKNTQKHE